MKWVSAVSERGESQGALDEVIELLQVGLGGLSPKLLVVFFSPQHSNLIEPLKEAFPAATLIGCSAHGVAGGGVEIEESVALSVTAAVLPDVEIKAFHLTMDKLPAPGADVRAWRNLLGVEPEHQPAFVLLPDPFTFDPRPMMAALDAAFPAAPKIGGLASGAQRPGAGRLLLNGNTYRSGLVGMALYGDVQMDTVVAQGCRPVGLPMVITRCDRNLIYALNGQPVITALESLLSGLTDEERHLFRLSPMVGLAMDPDKATPRPGEYLIRNIQGIARTNQAMAIGAIPRRGQLIHFHVRDAETSAQDLTDLLHRYRRQPGWEMPAGGLMFACLGRGVGLYGQRHHDTRLLHKALGAVPLGGFFCNGELGPVHGKTWLHGYTSAVGLFRARGWS